MMRRLLGIGLSLAALAAGVASLVVLPRLREEPVQAARDEPALFVEAIRVEPEDVEVVLTGLGTVRSRDVVNVAPEVAGKVVEVHPQLEAGAVIAKGETLFVVDPSTYQTQVDSGQASVRQLQTTVERLRTQYTLDLERLKTLERSRDLARAEFDRLKTLYEQDEVGTRTNVDQAERTLNQAQDQVDLMAQQLKVYPIQVREAESSLAASQARLDQNRIDLRRTRIVAAFDARVKSVTLEEGQYVAPGSPVLTLADDSVLELSVPLNGAQARRWLQFDEARPTNGTAWFGPLRPVECRIWWTEDPDHYWLGQLDRVEAFDPQTRQVSVAVRIPAERALSADTDALPLVEGMACRVAIPGRTMRSVFRLPPSAVNPDGSVYVAEDGRLKATMVEKLHEQDGYTFVSSGLDPGDTVVVTRLVNPLANTLLDIQLLAGPDSGGAVPGAGVS